MKPPSCKSWGLQTLTRLRARTSAIAPGTCRCAHRFWSFLYQLVIKSSYNQARCTTLSGTLSLYMAQCRGVSLNGLTAPAHQDFYMTPLTRQAPRPGLSRYSLALLLAVPLALVACGGGSSDAGVAAQPSGFTVG